MARKVRTARRQVETLDRDVTREDERVRKAEETLARGDEARAGLEAQLAALAERMNDQGFDPERHTALVAAIYPAWRLSRINIIEGLRSEEL